MYRVPGDELPRQLQDTFKITNHVGLSLSDKEEGYALPCTYESNRSEDIVWKIYQ